MNTGMQYALNLSWKLALMVRGHQRYDAEQGGLVLIRPDGYIGFWVYLAQPR
jgi:hypothetical protein